MRPSRAEERPVEGVYASLHQLVALEHRARGFSLLPRQPQNSLLAGRHASRLRGRGLDFEEIRRYVPGDDIRQMDWKVTARTRKPHSRVYREERERSALLLVDQRIAMFFGSVRNMKSVTAAEAAALAAWRILAQKDRVGALVFNDEGIYEFRPQRSRGAVLRILKSIVDQNRSLKWESGIRTSAAMFNEVLRRCEHLAKHDFLVCLISDGHGSDEASRRLLTRIARHNDVIFAFVHDPLEGELPQAGALVFSDGEHLLNVDTSDAKLRDRFHEAFVKQRFEGRKFLLQREVPVLPLSTAGDTASQVARLLGRRPR